MSYEVEWTEDAIAQLLAIVGKTGKSGTYVRALGEVNDQLGVDPRLVDAAVNEDLWRMSIGRLRIYYEIDDDTREVEIVGVRPI